VSLPSYKTWTSGFPMHDEEERSQGRNQSSCLMNRHGTARDGVPSSPGLRSTSPVIT